jgi:flagellar motor protein MotB
MTKRSPHLLWLLCAALVPAVAGAQDVVEKEPGRSVERHLSADQPFQQWSQDPALLEATLGDRLEEREVEADRPETIKLRDLVPPIRFESGVADIPPSTIEKLRGVLRSMQHLDNVRLHLVGHADSQPLSPRLAGRYGDNAGLSRERAGEVAEFVQAALSLPAEAISFEWAGDTQPIASNSTEEGRALNRRVEVEVWYDEIRKEKAVEEVLVPAEIKRVKICRTETVCKLRYLEGHEHRARVKNLVAPLHYGDGTVEISEEFLRQIREGLRNLRDKRNVQVKFIGFTDDIPLSGRAERIYGTHLALSKARARRVALAVQEALDLPSAAVDSDGRGASRPLAPNETSQGRALNRRVEVEFWHDDPLQELPDEPQLCPEAAAAEVVTRVYDPPWGAIESVPIEDGDPVIPEGYADVLRRVLEEVSDKTNARLRFVGYTGNERLDRRTALVYGDDIGLSTARARRTMEAVREQLGLSPSRMEHEGRGYVHANDVVNAGFIQDMESYVAVEVVYDELAVLDDYEGVDVTRITRELKPESPLGLNLMHITVDGVPVDDPGRSHADIQRCTDVALERTDIRFTFDDLESSPRLSVTSEPASIRVRESGAASPFLFRMYTNYSAFIESAEVRIFERQQSVRSKPLAAVPVGPDGFAEWRPPTEDFPAPVRNLKYVLRVYDGDGHFDETAPQSLWLARAGRHRGAGAWKPGEGPERRGLLSGYGESDFSVRNIPLGRSGTVRVRGGGIPPGHSVWLAGEPVPVDETGRFAAETILPAGMHTVEVAVLDPDGNGELFLRDLELEESDWFAVGVADLTFSFNRSSGPIDALTGADAPFDHDSLADGRLAFYTTGEFGKGWGLTASADTREASVGRMFNNFIEKSPDALFRRLEPDRHYPTFGDDGTVEENAPTQGKLYLKLSKDQSHALWGNFKVDYVDNELALVERGLYGANVRYQTPATTGFGEQRLAVDAFAAQPGTISSREDFRGTGGSLYFLRRQDLLLGSERLRIEVRDKDSGLVSRVVHLRPDLDYDIDYLQGRILLAEPIGSTVDDELLVRDDGLSGHEAWLVVQYEYTPGLEEIDALTAGGQGHYWLNDFIKLGLTASRNEEEGVDSSLYGADLVMRKSADSWLKFQVGRSEGLVTNSFRSGDGGFLFQDVQTPALQSADAQAYRVDVNLGVQDFFEGRRGSLSGYAQLLDEGYSASGLTALSDTQQFGSLLQMPVMDRMEVTAKADWLLQKRGLETAIQEVDVAYALTDHWNVSTGVRNEMREDNSTFAPVTQEEGDRTDAVVQLAFDSDGRWRSYVFGQTTLAKSGDREANNRGGIGGAYRVSDRLVVDGEVSHGDLGPAAKLGTSYQQSDRTHMYLNYSLDNERSYSGLHARRGNLVSGARTRLSDSSSVYMENRFQHSDSVNGLSRTMGLSFGSPEGPWSFGANWEIGTLIDNATSAETRRKAGGGSVGYSLDWLQLSSGVEYRFDETETPLDGSWSERTTWLFRNNMKLQLSPDWRLLGKFNHSFSDSSLGQFYDGGFTEAVLGYAYRPVEFDRLNALAKYTYFFNVPTSDQVVLANTPAQFIQKSHVLSLDLNYDLTSWWSIGGKYAYRLGEVSLDRENPDFFANSAHLFILRNDVRFLKHWEGSLEGRMLDLVDLDERRSGAVFTLYRYIGDHFKVGVGYNFTDFSDDLTDLSYDNHGLFLNVVGTL